MSIKVTKNIFRDVKIIMIKISNSELNILNDNFGKFQQQIKKQTKGQNFSFFISQIAQFEKQYKKAGLERSFAQNLFVFAQQMRKLGINEFPGMIFSHLSKMPFLKPHVKEYYARTALEFAREQGDSIHILARLVDLEKIYIQSGDKYKRTGILFAEEKVLIDICTDYKNAKNKYKTHSRRISPLNKYEMELAKTRVDIAKVVMKNNPKQAKILLDKALTIFQRENRTKEVDFVNLMLSELQENSTSII